MDANYPAASKRGGGEGRGGASMSITPAGSVVAFILLLALPSAWRRAGLRVVPVVVDVNDVLISNEYTRLKTGVFNLIDIMPYDPLV